MEGFDYHFPVRIHFGQGCFEESLRKEMEAIGERVMLAYGGGSLKRTGLYDRIVGKNLLIRRMYVVANHAQPAEVLQEENYEQLDLFADGEELRKEAEQLEKERRLQEAMLSIKQKYGKNMILHGTSYEDGATGRDRNQQIGGHKA